MTQDKHGQIISDYNESCLTLTMSHTRRKNALTLEMYDELASALSQAADRSEVRTVVITGQGDAFTAGNDLKDFMTSPPTSTNTPVFRFLRELSTFPKPLIAAVNGVAVGIGTTMLLHCDFVYATEKARFHMPFIQLGLVPEAGASWLLPQKVGHRRAAELLMLGEPFDSIRAKELGIINDYTAEELLLETVYGVAHRLATLPPAALRQTKNLLKQTTQGQLEHVMTNEGEIFIDRLSSPETAEALQAFFEKRRPNFSSFS